MPLTPVEVRHVELRRGLFGYNRAAVQRLLQDIADSFEAVWRERADLAERCETLETELNRHTELEALLRSTLVSAERASQEMKEQARRESDVIVTEANAEARKIIRDAISEKEQLLGEIRRIRTLLRSALDVLEEDGVPAEQAQPSSGPLPGTGLAPSPERAAGGAAGGGDQTDPGLRKLAG